MQFRYQLILIQFWIQDNFLKFHASTDSKKEKILDHKEHDGHSAHSPKKDIELQKRESKPPAEEKK
jgi:hypothetical protein